MRANLVGKGAGGRPRGWSAWLGRCGLGCCSKRLRFCWQIGGCPQRLPWAVRYRVPRFCSKCSQSAGWQKRYCTHWRVAKWCRGLLAWVLAVSKRRGVSANLLACVCLGRGLAPNPACSGHGFAVDSPWGLVGRSSVACCVGWTAPPCR